MSYEVFSKVLKAVNDDSSLNADNVIEKIDQEFQTKKREIFLDRENDIRRYKYTEFKEEYEKWKKDGSPLDCLVNVAAEDGYKNVLIAMVKAGANINGLLNYTTLHRAVEHRNIDMINFLLDNGADINAKDATTDKSTPLCIAVDGACPGYYRSETPEDHQNYKKSEEIAKLLIDRKADVNESNPLGEVVRKNGNINLMRLLVQNGAKVFDRYLNSAVFYRNINMAEFLIDNGANVNSRDGNTAMHVAAMNGDVKTMEFLMTKGADVNTRNNSQKSPLHFAAKSDKRDMAEFLIKNGAIIDVKDKHGNTPLHIAAMNFRTDIIDFLIKEGANVNSRNHLKQTPLHVAVLKNCCDEQVVLILVESGADPWITDNYGKTPIDYNLQQYLHILQGLLDFRAKLGTRQRDLEDALNTYVSKPGYLVRLNQAYNKDLIVRYSTMLIGAIAAYMLFTTGKITPDALSIIGAVAVVTAVAFAAGRITYEVFKPSTKMEKVDQKPEPPVEQYQSWN